jgi:hypothetical protein
MIFRYLIAVGAVMTLMAGMAAAQQDMLEPPVAVPLPSQVVAEVVWQAHGLRLPLNGAEIRQNTPERLLAQRQGLILSGAYWQAPGLALRDMARHALGALNLEEDSATIAVSEALTVLQTPAYVISGSGRQGSRTLDFALLVFTLADTQNFSLSVVHDDPEQPGNPANEQALLQGLQRIEAPPVQSE